MLEALSLANSLLLVLGSVFVWKTYKDRDFFWLAVIGATSLVFKEANSVIKTVLKLSDTLDLIRGGTFIVVESLLSSFLFVFLLKLAVRLSRKR
jgi:hypothetical protein